MYSINVHFEFRQYVEGREGEESLRLRVSSEEKTMLSDTLRIEGGNITELLVEGIWRVVGSRQSPLGQLAPLAVRPKQPKDRALSIRLSNTETAALSGIATEEGCSIGDLVGEGIWHVIANRQQNEYYQARAQQILALLNDVEAIRAALYKQV